MAVFKCKMCGGNLEIEAGVTVYTCEYCGTTQTVPSADDEKKMTLFTRANRLRFNNEFDKAAGVYEAIVADFPEEAEAYWGLVLCKYGIEYVDDPATAKKIPTCHRSSFDSVMDDSNFEMALEYADSNARAVYREEAKAIEELRKGIIEVSSKEEPYDIFICYKETAENGERTLDSVLAQDVYTELTDKGYRVFFARITLEDKLGQEYEPYIFAALNSAKVMLVFGTDYEYFNAVWVKNEWSRFLQLISSGEKKTLIPCYKGIDAYDLPKEFAKLQAQDLGKVGAIQDLVRGIEKIIPKEKAQETVNNGNSGANNSATIDSLLKRAFMFLNDGNFQSANEYCERVLDIDPECAEAYLGNIMVSLQVKKQEELLEIYNDISANSNINYNERFYALFLDSNYNNFIKFASDSNTIKSCLLKSESFCKEKVKNDEELKKQGFIIENCVLKKYVGKDMNITVPSFVTKIGQSAFSHCYGLVSVEFLDGITSIDFSEVGLDTCDALRTVKMTKNVTSLKSFGKLNNNVKIIAPADSFAYRVARGREKALRDAEIEKNKSIHLNKVKNRFITIITIIMAIIFVVLIINKPSLVFGGSGVITYLIMLAILFVFMFIFSKMRKPK